MASDMKQHSYEEIRDAIVDILTRPNPPEQWASLVAALHSELGQRTGHPVGYQQGIYGMGSMSVFDRELARDAFWDLFRQGMITLGRDDANAGWPFFRLSHLGRKELADPRPLRFYDAVTFLALVKRQVPDISAEALTYLREAAGAFYADLPLSACVMVGVAAEAEFIRLVDVAAAHPVHGSRFNSAQKAEFIGSKVAKFRAAMESVRSELPREALDNLDVLTTIQSIIRNARNDAGHPVSKEISRQDVYVYLQLFADMAKRMRLIREAFAQ